MGQPDPPIIMQNKYNKCRTCDAGQGSGFWQHKQLQKHVQSCFHQVKKTLKISHTHTHVMSPRENLLGLTPLNSRLVHHTVTTVNVLL